MSLHRRTPLPKEISMNVLRPSDTRFYWLQAREIPANVTQATVLAETPGKKIDPMNLDGKVTDGNSIYIKSASGSHTVTLIPGLVDFEKRVVIRQNTRQKFNDFVQPDLGVILEDLRVRGDRRRVFQAQIVVE